MRLKTFLLTSALLALCPAAALAQTAPSADEVAAQPAVPQEDEAGATNVGEVIVTARRRAEALRDVPIAVSAISGDALQRQQAYSVREVAQFTPGLNINSDGVGRAFVSIRGVGTTLIDTVQPGVGIFIDGIYQPNTSYLNSPLVDVERVEVLRGPQGTLFGNNTLGGAINVITRQPSDSYTFRGNAVLAGPDDFRALSASASGPIVEGLLQARVGVAYTERDGFQENTLAGGDLNPLTQESANATIRFTPTEWATFTVNANWDRVRGANTPYIGSPGPGEVVFDGPTNQNNRARITYEGINLRGDFDADSLNTTITAVLAYNEREQRASNDGDFGPVDFLRTSGTNELETTTGELRFDTTWNDRVSSLVGVFASRYTTESRGLTTIVPLSRSVPSAGTSEAEVRAIFGTVFVELAPRLDLAVGLRYDEQELNASTAVTAGTYEAEELQPRVTLTYEATEQLNIYGSIARGFRGGGQNGPGAPNLIYEGDSVWTYELGAKFQSADRRLTLDTAVFFNDYSDFIGQNALAPSTTGAGFVAINLNTGDVETYGFEAEGVWRPTDQLRFNAALTLLHARIVDDAPFRATTGTAPSSDRIIFTPDWNFNVGGSYTVPVGENALVFDANVIAKGDRVGSSLDPLVEPVLDEYFLLNASAAYQRGGLEVALFATNLLQEEYVESYIDRSALVRAGLASIARNLTIPGERRRVGVRFNYRY